MAIGTEAIGGALPDKSDPFRIDVPITLPAHRRAALVVARPFLSWVLSLNTYRALYHRAHDAPGDTFCARALYTLGISVDVADADVSSVPASDATIIVANHPHGMIDGLALLDVVYRRRRDVRIVTNRFLARIPELAEFCLFVDPFHGREAASRSQTGLRAAFRWLTDGHALILFPAGAVAHALESASATPADSAWHDTVGRLALRTGAAVVPAFIEGRNSPWFYRAGRVHPGLCTLLLARELLRQRGSRVVVRVGSPLKFATHLGGLAVGSRATAVIRAEVERLAACPERARSSRRACPEGARATRGSQLARHAMNASAALIDAPDAERLEAEIHALDADHRLAESGALQVFHAHAPSIPNTLREIGRLREKTFRVLDEGTGKAVDLDRFDEHYVHLFVWNRSQREIVGAYRLGLTDQIVAARGINGLYTSTLFRYDSRLLMQLSPAIELGRSFVREEYQRSSSGLFLLWKGIARFVARSHRYRVLFGPVSISSHYGDMSQQLLRSFLAQNFYHRELGELVEAITPPTMTPLPVGIDTTVAVDIRDVDKMIARLEADGKGIPVLLRQYLRLNAKLLGFNVDPAFGDALDALMMVDLATVDRAILNRYFGKDDAQRLLALFSTERSGKAAA